MAWRGRSEEYRRTLDGHSPWVPGQRNVEPVFVEDILVELGATVVGPAGSIEAALELAASAVFDAALLDINVRGQRIDPLAERLRARRIPMVFASGYGLDGLPSDAAAIVVEKPLRVEMLTAALLRVV